MITFVGLTVCFALFDEARTQLYGCDSTIALCGLFFVVVIIWIIGSTFSIIICEIIFFSPFALVAYNSAHENYVGGFKSILAKKAFDFIIDNKSLYTKIQNETSINDAWFDTMESNMKNYQSKNGRILNTNDEIRFRLMFVNYCFVKHFGYKDDKVMTAYLDKHVDNEWKDVTLKDLRNNCRYPQYAGMEYSMYNHNWLFNLQFNVLILCIFCVIDFLACVYT